MCIKNENGYIFCEETFGKDKENSSCPPQQKCVQPVFSKQITRLKANVSKETFTPRSGKTL